MVRVKMFDNQVLCRLFLIVNKKIEDLTFVLMFY